jgi:curved DNA-binding protein
MEFKDYYATLQVERSASADEIKRAYRKLARKYHPDVSKDPQGEARFKEVAEAYEVLKDPEKRAAYDAVGQRRQAGQEFTPRPGWDSGFEFAGQEFGPQDGADHSDFFESLFGRQPRRRHARRGSGQGDDHHAKVQIDLLDAYRGAQRSITLRMPTLGEDGRVSLHERQLDVTIPKGIRAGQQLRLAGQGGPGHGGAPAGDLYLEIDFVPHPLFRVDGRDVLFDLPLAPWEAALGASVTVPTPDGAVQLSIPRGTAAGRRLRLRGKGLPGNPPGDLYAQAQIAMPATTSPEAEEAWQALAKVAAFDPRAHLGG